MDQHWTKIEIRCTVDGEEAPLLNVICANFVDRLLEVVEGGDISALGVLAIPEHPQVALFITRDMNMAATLKVFADTLHGDQNAQSEVFNGLTHGQANELMDQLAKQLQAILSRRRGEDPRKN